MCAGAHACVACTTGAINLATFKRFFQRFHLAIITCPHPLAHQGQEHRSAACVTIRLPPKPDSITCLRPGAIIVFDRRNFLSLSAAAGAAVSLSQTSAGQDEKSSDKVRVGVMGLSRGQSLALDLAKLSGVEVATLCDVDKKRLDAFNQQFQEKTGTKPIPPATFVRCWLTRT